jgi:hypothetical protein
MIRRARPFGDFVLCLLGPMVWAAHFFVVYGAATLVCTGTGAAARYLPWIAAVATAIALASLGAFLAWQIQSRLKRRRRPDESTHFLNDVAIALSALSVLAIFAVVWPVFHLPACAPPFG